MSFFLTVGDIFHVEGDDVFCEASKNCISCPEDKKGDSQLPERNNKNVCLLSFRDSGPLAELIKVNTFCKLLHTHLPPRTYIFDV